MGRSVTPKYVVEIQFHGESLATYCWDGRPTHKRLEDYVVGVMNSRKPNGINRHLGYVVARSARIRHNSIQGATVVEWNAKAYWESQPLFEVI